MPNCEVECKIEHFCLFLDSNYLISSLDLAVTLDFDIKSKQVQNLYSFLERTALPLVIISLRLALGQYHYFDQFHFNGLPQWLFFRMGGLISFEISGLCQIRENLWISIPDYTPVFWWGGACLLPNWEAPSTILPSAYMVCLQFYSCGAATRFLLWANWLEDSYELSCCPEWVGLFSCVPCTRVAGLSSRAQDERVAAWAWQEGSRCCSSPLDLYNSRLQMRSMGKWNQSLVH